LYCPVLEVGQQQVDLVVEADLVAADGVEAVLPGLEKLCQAVAGRQVGDQVGDRRVELLSNQQDGRDKQDDEQA